MTTPIGSKAQKMVGLDKHTDKVSSIGGVQLTLKNKTMQKLNKHLR
jgi:hypothetical protein